MKDFRRISRAKVLGLLGKAQRYQLFLACMVIVLCFAIGNDVYAAKTVAQRHKDLLDGPRKNVDYSGVIRKKVYERTYGPNLGQRYLINPAKEKQPSMISALSSQADICNQNSSFITALPFTDNGTTVGATDDYDITGDPISCPSPTCEATSGSFPDRGYTYSGTGTGPDVAYKIAFIQPTSLQITLDPTDADPNADDLNIIVYDATCGNSPSTAIVLADNAGSGNFPDLADNSEQITFTLMPAGIYNIVVDGYTASGDPITSGAYSIDVRCVPSLACRTPGYLAPPRR